MPDGSGANEVRAVLRAAGRLASPGDVLFNVVHAAREAFDLLDYAAAEKAKEMLAVHLETTFTLWRLEIASFVRP